MQHNRLTRRLAASPLAPLAVLPSRVAAVARHNGRAVRQSAAWLLRSREHVHYTYDLEQLNLEHLAWFVTAVTNAPVEDVRGYLAEIRDDVELRRMVGDALARSPRRATTDPVVRFGRRIGWYALVRALRPEFVVETGTNRGLGSAVIAAALLRNGTGRLATVDFDDRAGELILPPYDKLVDRCIGDSVEFLAGPVARQAPIDLFISDTAFSQAHEHAELTAALPLMASRAVAVATRCDNWWVLPRWADAHGRRFLYFDEKPLRHWYPGLGIGAAFTPGTTAPADAAAGA